MGRQVVGRYAPAVARILIVGGGRRGMRLAERAVREGHAVRIVTRTEERRAEIEAAGAECWMGDPDRLGTLRGALEGVTIACWLLGTASGALQQLGALHGSRLRAFLQSAVDTTVRGVVYEVAGPVAEAKVTAGEAGAMLTAGGGGTMVTAGEAGATVTAGEAGATLTVREAGATLTAGGGGATVTAGGGGATVTAGEAGATLTAREAVPTLTTGERIATEVAGANAMPLAVLRADPRDLPAWLEQARAAVDSLLRPSPQVTATDTLS